jgi:hypothetical protein
MTTAAEDLVALQVPRSHYQAMVTALAVEMAKNGSAVQSAQDGASTTPAANHPFGFADAQRSSHRPTKPYRAWTSDELKALRQALSAKPVPRTMLELTYKQAGKPVAFSEVCEAAGVTPAQGRAGLAGLTVLVRRRFDRDNWPVDWKWAAGGEEQAYYVMPVDIASLWLES